MRMRLGRKLLGYNADRAKQGGGPAKSRKDRRGNNNASAINMAKNITGYARGAFIAAWGSGANTPYTSYRA